MWFGPKLRCVKMTAKQIQDKQNATLGFCKVSGNNSDTYRAVGRGTSYLQRHNKRTLLSDLLEP
jgi:hypothetical protein